MVLKIKLNIQGIQNPHDVAKIETAIDVLTGVSSITVDERSSSATVEFDSATISPENINGEIEKLGYHVSGSGEPKKEIHEHTFYVKGMHCSSCEILIEKELLQHRDVKSVEASTNRNQVVIEYEGRRPSAKDLSRTFKKEGYTFHDSVQEVHYETSSKDTWVSIAIAAAVIVVFYFLNKSGLPALVNVTSASSLVTFLIFGLLAGLSSCAALVGGLILSMSKQWQELNASDDSTLEKLKPHLMFNTGRLASYAVLGGVLGMIGSKLQISLTWTSTIVIAVSLLMLLLALQMLGVKAFQRFQITMPRFITRRIADESKFQGRYMPFAMGALTFLLPCGFTLTAQSLALLSGSAIQGGLIMLFFALGTLGPLLGIGLSSVKLLQNPRLTQRFLKVAGILVLVFGLYNINSQLNVLGAPSLSSISISSNSSANASSGQGNNNQDLPPIVNGKQVLKMEASSTGYSPNSLKVAAGTPVRWEITDVGTSGCTSAIISRSLFEGQIELTPGQTAIKEFTPPAPGKYRFSCWMGMISGVLEVVESQQAAGSAPVQNALANVDSTVAGDSSGIIPSGAQGCGCGGGANGSCGVSQN